MSVVQASQSVVVMAVLGQTRPPLKQTEEHLVKATLSTIPTQQKLSSHFCYPRLSVVRTPLVLRLPVVLFQWVSSHLPSLLSNLGDASLTVVGVAVSGGEGRR